MFTHFYYHLFTLLSNLAVRLPFMADWAIQVFISGCTRLIRWPLDVYSCRSINNEAHEQIEFFKHMSIPASTPGVGDRWMRAEALILTAYHCWWQV